MFPLVFTNHLVKNSVAILYRKSLIIRTHRCVYFDYFTAHKQGECPRYPRVGKWNQTLHCPESFLSLYLFQAREHIMSVFGVFYDRFKNKLIYNHNRNVLNVFDWRFTRQYGYIGSVLVEIKQFKSAALLNRDKRSVL